MFRSASSKGFTLVELMVVIVILAILSVVGIVVFKGVSETARDSRRRSDIESMAKAYEVNYQVGYYPLVDSNFASGNIPTPPEGDSGGNSGNYFNVVATDGSGFKACAALENNPSRVCNTPAQNCFCMSSSQGGIPLNTPPSGLAGTNVSFGLGGSSQSSCDNNGTLLTGLVGYWKMDESAWNGILNEVIDSSGYGNHGRAYSSGAPLPNTVVGNFGRAGEFSGGSGFNRYAIIPRSTPLDITGHSPITLSAWIYYTGINPACTYPRAIYKETWISPTNNGGYMLQVRDGRVEMLIKNAAAGGDDGRAAIVDVAYINQWILLVGTYDGTKIRLYVGKAGSIQKSEEDGPVNGIGDQHVTADLRLGGSCSMNGLLDDVRIYNRALSEAEINDLYKGGIGCLP